MLYNLCPCFVPNCIRTTNGDNDLTLFRASTGRRTSAFFINVLSEMSTTTFYIYL